MSTLKRLVDETTNIKNELISCHTNLKNILIEKGIECDTSYKLRDLVNSANSLKSVSIVAGNDKTYYQDNKKYSFDSTSYVFLASTGFDVLEEEIYPIKSVRFSVYVESSLLYVYDRNLYYKIIIKDGSENIIEKDITLTVPGERRNSTTIVVDIENPKPSYSAEIYAKGDKKFNASGQYNGYASKIQLKGCVNII